MRLEQLHSLSESDEAVEVAKWAGRRVKGAAGLVAKSAGYLLKQMFDAVLEAGGVHVHSGGSGFWDMMDSSFGGESMPEDVQRVLEALHQCVMAQSGHNAQLISPQVIDRCADKLADKIGKLSQARQLSLLRDYRTFLAQQDKVD